MNLKESMIQLVSNLREGEITDKPKYCDGETNLVCFNGAIAKIVKPELPCKEIDWFCMGNPLHEEALETYIGIDLQADINSVHRKLVDGDIDFEEAKREVLKLVTEWDDTKDWEEDTFSRYEQEAVAEEEYDDDEDW